MKKKLLGFFLYSFMIISGLVLILQNGRSSSNPIREVPERRIPKDAIMPGKIRVNKRKLNRGILDPGPLSNPVKKRKGKRREILVSDGKSL